MAKRILIGQIACFGDCLYATTVAKQIKHDSPDTHITWAVAAKYRSVLDHNPHIDAVWELPIHTRDITKAHWNAFEREAEERKVRGEFDAILYTQVIGPHIDAFRTTLRRAVFAIANRPITVDVAPVIRLTNEEIERVRSFAERCRLSEFKHVVLVESTPGSGQSQLNSTFALALADAISRERDDVCFVVSSNSNSSSVNPRVFDASVLSYRENAELTRYCTLLIGCSSGITWLATSDHARKLPMLQLLDERSPIFCGVNFDFEAQGLDNRSIIEMIRYDLTSATACVSAILSEGPEAARVRYNQRYVPNRHTLMWTMLALSERGESMSEIWRFMRQYVRENRELKNPIAVSRVYLAARLLLFKAQQSQNIVMRGARKATRGLRSFRREAGAISALRKP